MSTALLLNALIVGVVLAATGGAAYLLARNALARRDAAMLLVMVRAAIGHYLIAHPANEAELHALIGTAYGALPPRWRAMWPQAAVETALIPVLLQVEQALQQPPPIPPVVPHG